jgi:protein-tyrosine phosphatase
VVGRDRHLSFEACFNFRDLGGYETTDGRRVRWGALFRSDSLESLSDGDREVLRTLGLRTAVDLRSSAERARGAARLTDINGVSVHHAPLFEEHALPFQPAELTSVEPPPGETYLAIANAGTEALGAAVRAIAEGEHAVVFFCAAGRDRTGMVAALILSVLGVPDEAIVADYLLSDRALEPAIAWSEANAPARAAEFAALPDWLLHTSPGVMRAFLDGLRAQHGSIEAYLAAVGAGPDVVSTLKSRLLEEAAGASAEVTGAL